MKLGMIVNVMDSEEPGATSYRIAVGALARGHEVWIASTGNFSYNENDTVGAFARTVPPRKRYTLESFSAAFKSDRAINEWIEVDDLDVLLLRSNPTVQRGWAQMAGINFGRLAMRHGVIVVSNPNGLAKAMNKLYLQTFPQEVRPRTVITRHRDRIESFLKEERKIIVKPLQGSGGFGVFLLREGDANLENILKAVTRDGYVVAQEYLPAAAQGDVRMFVMDGVPLQHKGTYAAFRRVGSDEDIRSNLHAGGRLRSVDVDDNMLRIAESVRPRLIEDGMFLVGLDIAGDKLLEINVFSPGGLGSAQKLSGVDFTPAVLNALEAKVKARSAAL